MIFSKSSGAFIVSADLLFYFFRVKWPGKDQQCHNLYARVLGQDNTADRHRTFDGSKKYLEEQLRAYTNFTYTTIRKLNRFSGENRNVTGWFIYPPHDGSSQEKRYAFVKKFVSDLANWYGEDVG